MESQLVSRKCDICSKDFTVIDNRDRSLRCSKECRIIAHKQLKKNWQSKNKDRVDISRDKWKEENYEQETNNVRKNYEENKEDRMRKSRIWQKANPDKVKNNRLNRYQEDPGKYIAKTIERKAVKLKATLPGYGEDIDKIYREASRLRKLDKIKREVHHVIPLQQYSEIVSGLHVPWNLEILTEEEHLKAHEELRGIYGRN